ncbi:motility protein A [Lignipirellula cremea]|uniref:Chemotaxis protein PomA n=1 Tax=Lignipirellula cremea TaxID=2528010 RepID=A0A518E0I2_9BACT|nr:motility protein A [Lignipirellula cremea]QDU97593.1 Chemotaxis protein PomA [Lignipirellula cremea]
MDISSVVGLVLAFGLILASIMMGSAPFSAFIDIPSGLVVIGGAIAATMMCFPLKIMLGSPMAMMKVFLNKPQNPGSLIETLVSLAETARRDGLLALEGRVEEIDNTFIKMGVQMAVDGTQPDVIEAIMRTEMESINGRHKDNKAVLDQLGRFAPAYGMIGTLMGLIMMLSDMSDPSGIGAGMAVALITTLYGAIVSNVMFMPWAEKLNILNKQELTSLEIVIRGILSIQSGENPRVIQQKLETFLPPKARASKEGA